MVKWILELCGKLGLTLNKSELRELVGYAKRILRSEGRAEMKRAVADWLDSMA